LPAKTERTYQHYNSTEKLAAQ